MTCLTLLQKLVLLPQQPLTSGCFLRGLRSLTILAFLAGFLSSRSLSPSPLEELAEALLSNLHGATSLRAAPRHHSPEPSRAGAALLPLTALREAAFHGHDSLCSASWTFGALMVPGLSFKLPHDSHPSSPQPGALTLLPAALFPEKCSQGLPWSLSRTSSYCLMPLQ